MFSISQYRHTTAPSLHVIATLRFRRILWTPKRGPNPITCTQSRLRIQISLVAPFLTIALRNLFLHQFPSSHGWTRRNGCLTRNPVLSRHDARNGPRCAARKHTSQSSDWHEELLSEISGHEMDRGRTRFWALTASNCQKSRYRYKVCDDGRPYRVFMVVFDHMVGSDQLELAMCFAHFRTLRY